MTLHLQTESLRGRLHWISTFEMLRRLQDGCCRASSRAVWLGIVSQLRYESTLISAAPRAPAVSNAASTVQPGCPPYQAAPVGQWRGFSGVPAAYDGKPDSDDQQSAVSVLQHDERMSPHLPGTSQATSLHVCKLQPQTLLT